MLSRKHFLAPGLMASLIAVLFGAMSAAAQVTPAAPDPLARIRAVAAANAEACSVQETSACVQATPKIIASALGPSPLDVNLHRLTDEIGGRVTGSPQMARAVAWAVAAFRAAGVDDVHTEKFTVPVTWSEGRPHLEVLASSPFAMRLISVAWSPATPAGGLTAEVVDAGLGSEADLARVGGAARDAILLIHAPVLRTRDDLLQERHRNPAIITRSAAAGASAILWMSTREDGVQYRQMSGMDGRLEALPQAIVARRDAERLARQLAAGEKLRARLDLPNRSGGPAAQENVVAEIRGREKPDEFVVLGAHLDSWDLGKGALDAGCNAALVIEVARVIHLTGLRPRRSIRFVLFSGAEQGGLGSWAYVRAHGAELDRAVAAVFFSWGSGRVTGFSLGGRGDIEPGVRESLALLDSWDVNKHTGDASLGADNLDFLLEGVPNLVANQEDAGYAANHHTVSDTYDKVDLVNLKRNTAVAGVLAFGLAEHAAPLGRRLSRAEPEALLVRTGLDTEMKSAGLWRLWESRERGGLP